MSFGLRNAAATFQRFIDHVLEGMNNAIAYVDDIYSVFENSRRTYQAPKRTFR